MIKIQKKSVVQKMSDDQIDTYYKGLADEFNTIVDEMRRLNPRGYIAFDYPIKLISRKAILEQALEVACEEMLRFEPFDE